MKRTLLPLIFALMCLSAHATTWYVNSSTGGTRFSSANPTGQCNGQSDSAYPGTGVNQACPFNDPRLLWNDPYAYRNAAWVMAGGDTVILETSGQIAGSTDASAVGKFCFGSGESCLPPDLPSGSNAAHTRFLGVNYSSCSVSKTFTDASAPTLVGDPAKQTFLSSYTLSGETTYYALSVATSQYVDIACLDLSGHGDRAGNGIWSGSAAIPTNGNILIQDTTIHGFADSAWRGNLGGPWNLTRVSFQFNGQAGVNNDPGNNQQSIGSIIGSYVSIFGNGCSEEYPIVHPFSGINCKDQNNGGYGDGWGTSVTANLDFYCDHCLAAYNTQDGIDGGHLVGGVFSITNTQMYGNMGGNLKAGPSAVITFSNNAINANCMRMHDPITGTAPGFNSQLTLWCRAGDQNSMAAETNATALDGQMQASGTTVTGSNSHFLSQLHVGDTIMPAAEIPATFTRVVTAIASDTSLTVSSAFPHDIGSNEPIILIPAGGATSNSVLTIESSSFVGYAATMWDVPCQTGIPQAQVDIALCAGATFIYKNNVSLAYAESTYNEGQSPGPFYNLTPTVEDYNLFYGFRQTYGSGAHDISSSPLFIGQPAKPLTAETQMDSFNFNLNANSPAKWAGVDLAGLSTDFNGSLRHSPPTIGAMEIGSAAPTLPTPQIAFSITPNPATAQQTVTLAASMTGSSGVPTGTIIFSLAGATLGTATLDNSGTASVTTASLAAGVYLATASYSGDNNYAPITSSGVSLTVNAAGKTTAQVTLGLSSNTISALQPVSFTASVATVGGVTPTGVMLFSASGTVIGQVALDESGSATISTSSLAAGTYTVTASYGGDSSYTTDTSDAATLTVNGAGKTTSQLNLGLSSTSISAGQSLNFSAAVTKVGSVVPTGTITFNLAGSVIGQVALDANGAAVMPVSGLAAGTYTVTASYSGDNAYTSAASGAVTLNVNGAQKQTARLSLSLSANTIAAQQPVTFTASVASVGGVIPTGTMIFYVGGVSLGQSNLNGSGIATISTSSMAVGSYLVTATYSGDSAYTSETSAAQSLNVTGPVQQISQLSLTASSTTVVALQPVTLTGTVTVPGGGTPAGAVSFYLGTAFLGQAALNGSGTASITTSSLTVGTYIINSNYGGTAIYAPSSSNTLTLTVIAAAKTSAQISLGLSANDVAVSQPVTFTAVAASTNGLVPTGSVTFSAGGTAVGAAALTGAGVATIVSSSLPVGTYTVTASYSGDTNFNPGVSGSSTLTVSRAKTSAQLSLGLSASSVAVSQPVTFTAVATTVGGVVPTGSVIFTAGGNTIGTSALNGTGTATLTTSSLQEGSYVVSATYSGDTNYSSDTSNSSSLTITAATKTVAQVSLSLSPSSVTRSQPVTFTATAANVGGVVPTGSITFAANGTTIGTSTLNGSGVATLTTSSLQAGSYAVVASYSGDGKYTSGASNSASLTVTDPAKTTAQISLSLSASTVTVPQPVTFTANAATVGGVVPTGTVTFSVGGLAVGTSTLNGSGVATLSTSSLPTGTFTVFALYSGDSSFSSGASNSTSLTVNPAPKTTTQVSLSLSASTVTVSQPLTLTAAAATVAGVVPTGSVVFSAGGTTIGMSDLNSAGVATLTTTSLAAGSYSVIASYSGDSGYNSVASTSAALTVNPAPKTTSQVSLNLSASSVTASKPVTFTAATATVGGVIPTGSVIFSVGGTTIGTSALNGAGVATLTTTSLAAGSYSVIASYSGDSGYTSGTSTSATLTVTALPAGVSITVGQPEFGFNVIPGSTRRIFATVAQGNTNQVIWTLKSGTATLSSNAGSWIDVTAPATGSACSTTLTNGNYVVSSTTQFTVDATSVDDGTKSTDITFNVCNPAVQISVVPFYKTVYASQPADLQSLIVGSIDPSVHWAITSKPQGGDGTLGDTTSRDTVFAATVAGRYTLTATSQADPSKTANAVVFVTGNTIPYAGPVTPNQTQPVDCSVDPAMAGTVYNVGPSQAFKTLANVPFPTMVAGSTVRLFNEDKSGIKPTEYHEYVQLSQAGTATQPIRICGVPDSSGNLPVIDGSGATSRIETSPAIAGLGLITLHKDNNTAVWPNFGGAAYIAVEGIHFRNAKPGFSYVSPNGSTGAWAASSACVRVNQGQNLAFAGNDFDNCGDGVYAAWNGTGGWGSSDTNVLWEGNHLHNNGVASSDSHQMYLESWGNVVQFNRLDNYTAGGLGANLKSRGLQDVIRYNYFGDGPMRQMDLVDVTSAPTYMSFSGFLDGGASSYHASNPSDAYSADQLAAAQEAWNSHYAYGNIYQNSVATAPFHFSMDTNGNEQARKGSLYWYNNTFNETACSSCQGQTLTLFDTAASGGTFVPQTEFQTVQSFNNIIWLTNPAQMTFQWNNYDAFIGVSGANLLTANWGTNSTTGGAGSGWNATVNTAAYQNAENLSLHLTGFSDKLTTATTIPFNAVSWALNGDVQGNQAIPSAVCQMPPRFSYMPSLGYAIPRITGPNMGATDTTPEAAAMMTTLVGPKQYNSHYSNCR